MPFKPGQSGNPSGRARMPEELKIKFRDEIPSVVDFWIETYRNTSESFANRNKAAENLIYYGYGKPRESVDLDVSGKIDGITIEIVKKIDADNDPSLS
jgi:hypothetical protein